MRALQVFSGLHLTAHFGLHQTAKSLISERRNFDINLKICEQAPLLIAATRGADVNMQNRFGTSPLDTAVFLSTVSMVHLLIKKGAVIDSPNVYEKKTPLFYATQVWTKHNIEKTSLLLEKDADVNARDKYGLTPLANAYLALEWAKERQIDPSILQHQERIATLLVEGGGVS